MICRTENIKIVRPIAANISEYNRIVPYIEEAERLDVMPYIGVSLYKQLDEIKPPHIPYFINDIGGRVDISKKILYHILCGGYYTDNCGVEQWHGGLIKAISYLAYARCIMQHQVNVTAFGVVFKESQFSEPIDEKTLIRAARTAEKTGLEFLRQVREYLKYLGLLDCGVKNPRRKNKFSLLGN